MLDTSAKDGRVLLNVDGTRTDIFATPMTLEQWQKTVGGYVEVMRVVIGKRVCQVLMDEDGRSKGLPVNRSATELVVGKLNMAPPGLVGPVVVAWGRGRMT